SRLRSIFRSLGKPANLAGRIVRPHRNGLAHGKPPQFAILNHAAIDSGIPKESATQRLGISSSRVDWPAQPFLDLAQNYFSRISWIVSIVLLPPLLVAIRALPDLCLGIVSERLQRLSPLVSY